MADDSATLRIELVDEGTLSESPSTETASPPPERVAPPPMSQAASVPQSSPLSAPPAPGEVSAHASPAPLSAPASSSPLNLEADHVAQLVAEFGHDLAKQILAMSGATSAPEAMATLPTQGPPPVGGDGFDPVKLAEQRIERERKARLVEEEYRRLNPPPPELPFDPLDVAKKRIEREEELAKVEEEYKKLRPPEVAFDPVAVAKKRIEREEQIAAADEEYRKLKPPEPEPAFDPVAVAKKRVEREEQLAAADAEYRKLRPEPVFDANEEARKRLDAEAKRKQVQDAYDRLNPPEPEKPFDPFESAEQSREGALKAERISAAYEQMYGAADKTRDAFDQTLEIADKFRGTIGGVFGTLVGAGLDIAAMVRKEMAPPKSQLRQEAERLNAQAMPRPEMPTAPKPSIATPMAPLEVAGKTFDWQDAPDLATQQEEETPKAPADTSPIDAAGEAMQSLAAKTTAAGDGAAGLAGTASTVSSSLGPVAVAATAATIGIAAMTSAALAFDDAVTSRAEKYAAYSPQLAMAQAQIDVQRMMADMRRAQEYGPQLAQYLQAKADLEQKWEETKVQIMMKLLPLAEMIVKLLGGVVDTVEFLANPVAAIEKWAKKIAQNTEKDQDLDNTTPWASVMGGFFNPNSNQVGIGSGGGAVVTPFV